MGEEGRTVHSDDDIDDDEEAQIHKNIYVPLHPVEKLPFQKESRCDEGDEDQLNQNREQLEKIDLSHVQELEGNERGHYQGQQIEACSSDQRDHHLSSQ